MTNLGDKLKPFSEKYSLDDINKDDKEFFAAAINIALVEYGISEEKFADDNGVGQSTVRKWAAGLAQPMPRTRESVLEYINENIS